MNQPGVLIFKGMTAGFLPDDLVISIDNKEESKAILSTSYNVIPIWLKIGYDSLKESKIASENISAKWNDNPELQKELLMAELASSMQVAVACGIALDALYDTLNSFYEVPLETIERWRTNRSSRAKKIIEVIKLTYKPKPHILKNFSACIKEIMKFRDLAVHPSLELKNSVYRDDIHVGVDWKFSTYQYLNVKRFLTNTIHMIDYLHEHKSGIPEVDASISNVIEAIEELKIVKRIK